jgi:hypothetical protein
VRPQGGGEVLAATFRRDQHVFAVAVLRTAGPAEPVLYSR